MNQAQDRTLHYYRQQQYQPGWFDLLNLMIEGMLHNAGERESQAFLQQMGDTLASRYPLAEAATVAELEQQVNAVLARFGWGVADIQPYDRAIIIDYLALPASTGAIAQSQWQLAMGAVLQGLFARWLRGQGGGEGVSLSFEETGTGSLRFHYQARG